MSINKMNNFEVNDFIENVCIKANEKYPGSFVNIDINAVELIKNYLFEIKEETCGYRERTVDRKIEKLLKSEKGEKLDNYAMKVGRIIIKLCGKIHKAVQQQKEFCEKNPTEEISVCIIIPLFFKMDNIRNYFDMSDNFEINRRKNSGVEHFSVMFIDVIERTVSAYDSLHTEHSAKFMKEIANVLIFNKFYESEIKKYGFMNEMRSHDKMISNVSGNYTYNHLNKTLQRGSRSCGYWVCHFVKRYVNGFVHPLDILELKETCEEYVVGKTFVSSVENLIGRSIKNKD